MFPELVGLDEIEGIGCLDLMALASGAYDEIREDLEQGQIPCSTPYWPLTPEQIADIDRLMDDFWNELLDRDADTRYNASMSKCKPKPTVTDALKVAIERSGLTRYRIAKDTGIDEAALMRFLRGETSLRLDKADRLAAYLGLRLVPDPDAVPPEPTPENLARPMLAKHKVKRKMR